jgi:adenylate cyclase
VRVEDAYADARFNQAVDAETGFRTRSVLCLPLRDRAGDVFAVTQLLNRRDGLPFDAADERRYADFAASLSVLLESLARIDAGDRRRTFA